MRILLISGSLPPMKCGVGDYTANLANALARHDGTKVAVLTDTEVVSSSGDFEFDVLPIAHGWRIKDALAITKAVRSWKPDIVHIQYPTQGYGPRYLPWLLPLLLGTLGVPVVQTWHEYHANTSRRNMLNAILGGGLVAVKPDYKTRMPSWYRWLIRRKHFEFIPNASAIPQVSLSVSERRAIKEGLTGPGAELIVYFGFAYPAKGVELIFEFADPAQDHVVLICDLDPVDEYHERILQRTKDDRWLGSRVTVTGFLPSLEVGKILAAADAVVLPFRDGGGGWNTSIHAATLQGTFVLTTSTERQGYDATRNVYFANPGNVAEMRSALRTYVTRRGSEAESSPGLDWRAIAEAHEGLYRRVLCR